MASGSRPTRRAYKELSLAQLRSFCEVCEVGGFAPAARRLMLTGPAVWEQIRALEQRFGLTLLERHGNGVRPTIHGRRLLELTRPLLAGLESAAGVLQQQDGSFPERLTVVSNLRVLVEEISRAMVQFRTRYPSVRLVVRYTRGEEVEPLIREGIADVTLTLEPGPDDPASSAIVYEPAGALDYLLVTPPGHPLLTKPRLRLEALVDYPFVLGEPETYSRHRVEEVFHRNNLLGKISIAVETSSDEYTLACVRNGLGIGIAVGNAASPLYRELGVRSLRRWFGTARVGFMWRRGSYVPPLQREMAQLLEDAIANKPRSRPSPRQG